MCDLCPNDGSVWCPKMKKRCPGIFERPRCDNFARRVTLRLDLDVFFVTDDFQKELAAMGKHPSAV